MAGELQPLDLQFPIVDAQGRPTQYFIRWAQQRQIDITEAITLDQLGDYLATHLFHAAVGSGIGLAPDGNLANSPAITAKVQEILDQISAVRGTILYRGAAAWAALAPGAAGQFLQTAGAGADPLWAAGGGGGGSGLFAINAPPAFAIWVNQGTASATTNADGTISLVAALDAAENIRGVFRALPATPWSFKIGFVPHLAGAIDFQNCGIALRDSVSGKMVVFCAYQDAGGSGPLWFVANYNSPTSKNANVLVPKRAIGNGPKYLKIADDGVTRTAAFGDDPYVQKQAAYSVAHASFIVPDQIGIITNNTNATIPLAITVFSHQ